jgi:hypothetical protein
LQNAQMWGMMKVQVETDSQLLVQAIKGRNQDMAVNGSLLLELGGSPLTPSLLRGREGKKRHVSGKLSHILSFLQQRYIQGPLYTLPPLKLTHYNSGLPTLPLKMGQIYLCAPSCYIAFRTLRHSRP